MAFKAGAVYGEAILDTKQWDSGLKKLSGNTVKGMKTVTGAMVKGVALASGAFIGAMTKNIAVANEFQKEMANVNTVVDESVVSTQDLTKELLKLDPALGSTTELTKGLYQSFSAGASDAEEALQITTNSAKFAQGALTDMSTAVDVLTTAQNAYGSETVNTTQASDIFFTTIKQGKITGEQLASTIGKSIPLFASLNIPLEELSSGMAAMTKQGVNAAESTTQLNAIVNSFLKPSADMKKALEEQGIASGATLLETEGLTGALKFLDKASGGSKEELSRLLPSIEAVRGTLALTGKGGEEFTKILGEMENATGATDIAFEKQEKTFNTLKDSLGKIQIITGNIGKHFIDEVAVGATGASESIVEFIMSSSVMETVGEVVGFVAASFDTLSAILKPLVGTVFTELRNIASTIWQELKDIGGAAGSATASFDLLGMITATLSVGFKQVSTVIRGVITNVGNLVEAIALTGNAVGSFFEMLTGKKSWDEVKNNVGAAGEAFKNFGVGVIETAVDMTSEIQSAANSWLDSALTTSRDIEIGVVDTFTSTKNSVLDSWDEMITGQKDYSEESVELTKDTQEEIVEIVEESAEEQKDIVDEVSEHWGEALMERADTFFEYSDIFVGAFSSMWSQATDIQNMEIQNQMDSLTALHNQKMTNMEDELTATQEANQALIATQDEKTQQIEELVRLSFDVQKKEINDAFKAEQEAIALSTLSNEEKATRLVEIGMERQEALMLMEEEIQTQVRNNLDDEYLAREQAIADGLAQEEAEQAAILQAEEDHKKEMQRLEKEQFEAQKKNDIAAVWIDAFSSIAGWWTQATQLGPVAGPIFAGVMTAASLGMAAKQTSAIQGQTFVPAFETGGTFRMNGQTGVAQINESGGELVKLPDGTVIVPNDISREIAGSAGGNNSIYFDFREARIDSRGRAREVADMVNRELGRMARA